MKTHKNVLTMLLLLLIAYAGLLGYFIITSDVEIDFQINWNMFKSALLTPLAIIGFFVGLGMKFPQYVPFLKITHSDGTKEYKRDYDVIENMFAGIVMPLLQVFVIAPLMIAAMIYYPLMVLIYFFGKIFSYLILVFFLLTIILFYKWEMLQLPKRSKAISMPLIALLLIGVLWFFAILWVSYSHTPSYKIINIVTIVLLGITVITFITVSIWVQRKQNTDIDDGNLESPKISKSFILTYIISFLVVLFVSIGFRASAYYSSKSNATQVSGSHIKQPNYYCSASTVLNIREQPNKNARVIGQLKSNEEVYVYTIMSNGFAQINFKEGIAYVSAEFLSPKNVAATTTPANSNTNTTTDNGMSGRKTVLIYGTASKVTYPDGSFIEFYKDGSIARRKDSDSTDIINYSYVTGNRYKIGNDSYINITYTNNSRHEITDDSEKLETSYEFDNKGRLSKEGDAENYIHSVEYFYKDNELLPYKVVDKWNDEYLTVTTTSLYKYKAIDNNGNWLSCDIENTIINEPNKELDPDGTVTNLKETTTETENKSLTRKIEYYSE